MLGRIKLFIGKFVRLAYRLTYRLIPCEKNTVLFISFHGRGYSDNPKAIYEYLRKENKKTPQKLLEIIELKLNTI